MSYHIRQAVPADLPQLASLFDSYRQFYECPSDQAAAVAWLQKNMIEGRSVVLVAETAEGTLLGFTQLYPALCSVDLVAYYVLYDLFVLPSARRTGVGKSLMRAAEGLAREQGMARLDLETARDNHSAQQLYEGLGYVRDSVFYKYSLALAKSPSVAN
ncbi:MAG: GNAT family N-acetyltransferase [Cellvibrionales bacterium]|jgi:ribosomal protein S18 acetylase RimI-like enzyme